MTAGNNSDWLISGTLGRLSRYEEVEDCNKDPCAKLFFAGCFLLLPREKEKPDTQATSEHKFFMSSEYFQQ